MNSVQLAIERERRNADMWRVYRPMEAAKSEARIKELQGELAQVFREELELLARFEAQAGPIPKPPILNPLSPMNMNECLSPDGVWICDEWNGGRRPR